MHTLETDTRYADATPPLERLSATLLPRAEGVLTSENDGCPQCAQRDEQHRVARPSTQTALVEAHHTAVHTHRYESKQTRSTHVQAAAVCTTALLALVIHQPCFCRGTAIAATHQFVVQRPADPSRRSLIDQLALQVSQRGTDYEQSILEQHAHARTQPTHPYAFLFAIDSPDNLYYRWRVYSLRSGGGGGGTGGLERWDTRPFQMVPHGPTWLPPVEGGGARVDEQPRGTEESGMTSDEVGELQRLLSTLTLQRPSILATMGWCMEHAVAAPFIVRSICTALLSPSSDSCRRVSLLYLLSDLLYNSSAPVRNASLFRREASQPNNNSSLHSVWAAFSPQHRPSLKRQKDGVEDEEQPGSAAAVSREDEQQRQQHTQRVGRKEREAVLSVLRTWQTWSLFESERIEQWMLSVRGLQAVAAAQPAAASGQSPSVNPPPLSVAAAADTVDADDVDGVPLQ